ncbi:MAG: elongation factor P [Planctomycetota bacterium]
MSNVRATEIKKNMTLVIDGELFQVLDREHVTPGKGQAVNHVKLRNLKTGSQKQLRLSSSQTVELAYLDHKNCQYLYRDSTGFVFMDEASYDQFPLPDEVIGDRMGYIKENESVIVTFYEGAPLSVELPAAVELEVTEAEEAIKGNTATNVTKNAVLETGLAVKVPMHIKVGEKIRISTDDGSFLGRA